MLSKLIAALQNANLEMTAEEIADTLWLALHLDSVQESADTGPEVDNADEILPDNTQKLEQPLPQETARPSSDVHMNPRYSASTPTSHLTGLPFRSPGASALPNTLALSRALRPLMRRISSKTTFLFNETATVEAIAETQNSVWLPVLEPAPIRRFDIALVIDDGASMMLWRDTIVELRTLLERLGAFRDVRVWKLATDDGINVQLYAETDSTKEYPFAHNPKELIDPTGHRLILLVTDCVSVAWHSAKVQQLLDIWGKKNLVTLIQMLPHRLWQQTALNFANTVQIEAPLQEISNAGIKILQSFQWFDEDTSSETSFPVPMVTLEPRSLLSWSHIVTGSGGTWITGKVFEKSLEENLDNHFPIQDEPSLSAHRRVQLFHANASLLARKLAGLLAAAPIPISFQVIRLIRQTMLPQAEQVHIAEVLLGGLLEEIHRNEMEADPDLVEYDFIEGVRDELLNAVPIPDGQRVIQEISAFVGQRYGQTRDFLALVTTQEKTGQSITITSESRPFAQIAATVLRRFGGDFASVAENLEKHIKQIEAQSTFNSIESKQTKATLEPAQAYSSMVTGNSIASHKAFLSKTWCEFNWTEWISFDSADIKTLPTGSGIYRIRAVGGDELFYIGHTGRNLRERIGDLIRNTMRDPSQMPFNDPHTAAPSLWAWRDANGINFECSILSLPALDDLEMLVHYFLWQYRLEKGTSTLANHGRFHPNYTKSGNRSTGRRGYRLSEGASNSAEGPSLTPLRSEGMPLDRNWMGLNWVGNFPLANINFKNIELSPAAYKVMDIDARELLLVGTTPNLRNRLQDLQQKNWDRLRPTIAFALQEPNIQSYQLAELENDLLGGYYEQMKKAPKSQFGKLQPPTIIEAEVSGLSALNIEKSSQDKIISLETERIPLGSHICQLYSRVTEITGVTARLLRVGLSLSEKCCFAAAPTQVKELRDELRKLQVDVEEYIASGKLVLYEEREPFLIDGKRFDPYFLLASHETFIAQALREGWQAVRISIDMTWLAKDIATPEQILKYEAASDAVFAFQNAPIIALMHYDHSKLQPSLVVEMLKLHPISVVGKFIKRNPYYLNSEQYMLKILRINKEKGNNPQIY